VTTLAFCAVANVGLLREKELYKIGRECESLLGGPLQLVLREVSVSSSMVGGLAHRPSVQKVLIVKKVILHFVGCFKRIVVWDDVSGNVLVTRY